MSVRPLDDALHTHVRDTAFRRDLPQRSTRPVRLPDSGVTLGRRNIGVAGCVTNKFEHACGGRSASAGFCHGTPHRSVSPRIISIIKRASAAHVSRNSSLATLASAASARSKHTAIASSSERDAVAFHVVDRNTSLQLAHSTGATCEHAERCSGAYAWVRSIAL